ncbi:tryptophan synthase beta subunit-like PLP-dependent enzyme [Massarina eburnea CBS 473.64]|uniref:Tryptophan synthase beta subunit-like PLP-dependent enzyme n=1 Tax=Massarina eburnea CBS 473.64 TaxID=1395130 RepID=A0A6A6RY12_9PLEO|nr:tryptophan synthase beta subunit-like PLP-dependent enzyme [Massarina eburnea CBS 473.64]
MYFNPSASSWKSDGSCVNPAVEPFHRKLPDYNTTPLVPLPDLAKELGLGHVLLKDESNRFGLPAFKILGASWAVYKAVASECELPLTCALGDLGASARERGVRLISSTEGNWGRAVARMAKHLEIASVIFVPEFMDRATQDRISREGAKLVVVNGDYDKSIEVARMEAEKENSLLVMDVSWEGYEEIPQWVVEGYSTMLAETEQQVHELKAGLVTHAIASVGVGSWAQAVALHYKSESRSACVIAVEPDTAACLQTSLRAGKIVPIETRHTIMNGMNCGTVSYTAWKVLKDGVDACVEVTDVEAHQDLQYLHVKGVKNGPCGAAPLSALRRLTREGKLGLGKESIVVLFSTEGAREYDVPT